jgi:hypothetical protein
MAKQVWKASYLQWFKGLRGGPAEFTDTFLAEDSVEKACAVLVKHAMGQELEGKDCSKVKIITIEKVGDPLSW